MVDGKAAEHSLQLQAHLVQIVHLIQHTHFVAGDISEDVRGIMLQANMLSHQHLLIANLPLPWDHFWADFKQCISL